MQKSFVTAGARISSLPPFRWRHGGQITSLVMAMAILLLSGCGGGSANTQRSSMLQPALQAYAAGQYAIAAGHAKAAANSETGIERDQANYLAGLSAYRSNRLSEADGLFRQSERSSDTSTAANSQAMLGVIRLREDRPSEAAAYLEQASGHLTPSDARQAARWTAFAYELTGNLPNAARARQASTAPGSATQQPFREVSVAVAGTPKPMSGLFALQIGAFTKRTGAENAAKQAAVATTGSDLGPVRVFESDASDKPRFLVQVGAFNTRSAAASARKRVGQLAYIVAPAADGRILETVWPNRRIAEAKRTN